MDRRALLNSARDEGQRLLFSRALDKIDMAESRGVPCSTGFLSLAERAALQRLLMAAGYSAFEFFGGYPEAERRICIFIPEWQEREQAASGAPLSLLRCEYSEKNRLTHRDILGALMALGIEREKTGDIIVSPGIADVIICRDIEDYLLSSLTSAGRAHLSLSLPPLGELMQPKEDVRTVKCTVSSPRLDALISAAFNLARGRAAELVSSGRVQLNSAECLKPDRQLSPGDTVSCRGFGKFTLSAFTGFSKKGRLCAELAVRGGK